jgi:hypothetical protein
MATIPTAPSPSSVCPKAENFLRLTIRCMSGRRGTCGCDAKQPPSTAIVEMWRPERAFINGKNWMYLTRSLGLKRGTKLCLYTFGVCASLLPKM